MAPRQRIPRPADWSPASGPTWRTDVDLHALTTRPPVAPVGAYAEDLAPLGWPAPPRLSAVLVALSDSLPDRPGVHVLVTRRADHLRNHAGEVSFPGGRIDPDESPVDAALREATEEVALAPHLVDVHGELPHLSTFVSRSHIVPIVGVVHDPPPLVPNPGEVDAAYWVAIADLLAPGVHHRELWVRGDPAVTLEFFELPDDTVWGATARVLVSLLADPRVQNVSDTF